jgi:hypothetical protein
MTILGKLVSALNEAEEQVADERQRISELIRGKDEPLARQIWDEESSQILRYYEEEVEVAESRLVLHDADTFHLPKPHYSDKHAWDESRLTYSRYLISDERRKHRRALLEERRREDDVRSARGNQKIGIGGLIVAGIALVPAFISAILDLLKG